MPIQNANENGVILTTLSGVVTDDELLKYYLELDYFKIKLPWRELTDGRNITTMAITPDGQKRLAAISGANIELLRGGKVAMVATSDVVFGMFRMWEIQRSELNYEVRVFRDIIAARQWLDTFQNHS